MALEESVEDGGGGVEAGGGGRVDFGDGLLSVDRGVCGVAAVSQDAKH